MAERTLDQFAKDLDKLGSGELRKRIEKILAAMAQSGEGLMKKAYTRSGLKTRTGALMGSLRASTLASEGGLGIALRAGGLSKDGKSIAYAGTQEFGATITGNLRIPFSLFGKGPALTDRGVDRYPPPLRITGGGLFFRKGRALFHESDPDGIPWYILTNKVKIPARPFVRPALQEFENMLPANLRNLVESAIIQVPMPKVRV